jgi:hypothetical protein
MAGDGYVSGKKIIPGGIQYNFEMIRNRYVPIASLVTTYRANIDAIRTDRTSRRIKFVHHEYSIPINHGKMRCIHITIFILNPARNYLFSRNIAITSHLFAVILSRYYSRITSRNRLRDKIKNLFFRRNTRYT